MSRHCQSLESPMGTNRKRVYDVDTFQRQHESYSTYSSSPPRSSSPPSTPHTSRHYKGCAYIRSSPGISEDASFRSDVEQTQEDWRQSYSSWKSTSSSCIRRSVSIDDFPPISDYDPSGLSEDPRWRVQYSKHTSINNTTPSSSYSDSDEELDDIFGSHRTTFFSTSAERGLWKNEPVPQKKNLPAMIQLRASAPSLSGVSTPTASNFRTVSEPAPTTTPGKTRCYPANPMIDKPNVSFQPGIPSRSQSLAASFDCCIEDEISSHTLPSLTTDIGSREFDTDIDIEVDGGILSPLPPSSPPFSPSSRSISILSRSSSPFSFSHTRDSSPLSELPDDFDDQESQDGHENSDGIRKTTSHSVLFMTNPDHSTNLELSCHDNREIMEDFAPPEPELSFSLEVQVPSTLLSIPSDDAIAESTESDLALSHQDDHPELPFCLRGSSSESGSVYPTSLNPYIHKARERESGDSDPQHIAMMSDVLVDDDPISNDSKRDKRLGNSSTLKDKNGILHRSSSAESSLNHPSTQKLAESPRVQNGSAQKKRKVGAMIEKESSSSKTKCKRRKVECKKRVERVDEENDQGLGIALPQQKKRKDALNSRPTKRAESKRRIRASSAHDDDDPDDDIFKGPLDSETRVLHATICGMVIETIATSRASSLPVSSIYKLVMNSQPALKSQRSEDEWLQLFERVLRSGEVGRGSGVFGKVESSGKDRADRPLEAQWFYVPERDQDQERAALIRSLMPRPGKRTETMKYKQYYWRPLGRISKWDPEDEL